VTNNNNILVPFIRLDVLFLHVQYPKDVGVVIDKLMGDLNGYFGDLGEEMEAIANYLDVDLGIIVTLNLAYELRRVWSDKKINNYH
jgi:hypothetical protein